MYVEMNFLNKILGIILSLISLFSSGKYLYFAGQHHEISFGRIFSCEVQLNMCTFVSVCLCVRFKTEFLAFWSALNSLWQLMTTYDSKLRLITACDSLYQLMTALTVLWQLMTTYDCFLQLTTAFDILWQLLATYDSLWQLMTTFDCL